MVFWMVMLGICFFALRADAAGTGSEKLKG
jgi:hypothetical protein